MLTTDRRYIVNIMAHNEGLTIEETISSVLNQEVKDGNAVEIHVFANGCTDKTEDIVKRIAEANNNVILHSILKKGKVNALKECISYFKKRRDLDLIEFQDRFFFMDADITFTEKSVLVELGKRLTSSPDTYLVSGFPVPESFYNQKNSFVSKLSNIRCRLQYHFKMNQVRGACYAIRWSVLQRVVFPTQLLSDDMFLECKLNGHFIMDHNLQVIYKNKKSLKLEIERELFLLIAREQVYYWRRKGLIRRLDPKTAIKEACLSYIRPRKYLWFLIKERKIELIAILGIWMLIYKCIEFQARRVFYKSLRSDVNLIDKWSTKR